MKPARAPKIKPARVAIVIGTMAMMIAERAPQIIGIEALKFREVLQPGDETTLRVELDPARAVATFRLWQGERVFSSGRLLLREPGR